VGETTIAAIHGSRANRAGSFQVHKVRPARLLNACRPRTKRSRGYVCQEADQHLQSAKKNTHGNSDKGTRQNARINESSRSLWKAVWMRWRNCGNMLQNRRRYSTLAQKKLKQSKNPGPMAKSASDINGSLPEPNVLAAKSCVPQIKQCGRKEWQKFGCKRANP
jgi:hypothetical protein